MCGRLPVGKGFFGMMHGWSVLPCVRPVDAALPMAAGHNALREIRSRSKTRSQKLPWHEWGVPISGSTGWVHYLFIALSNFVSAR